LNYNFFKKASKHLIYNFKMKSGILAVAALIGSVSAGCGAPLFSGITVYKDAFCILEDFELNSKETNL